MSVSIVSLRLTFLAVAMGLSAGCHRSKPQLGMGDEWRSLSSQERQILVSAYLDGYGVGQAALCENIDREAEQFKIAHPDPNFLDPCAQLKGRYSHTGSIDDRASYTAAYTSVIDDFYKHPECRVMPYIDLLEHSNDREFKSGDELFHAAQTGQLHWGFFSGFDGMDKCLIYPSNVK